MRYCPNCKENRSDDMDYCPKCGARTYELDEDEYSQPNDPYTSNCHESNKSDAYLNKEYEEHYKYNSKTYDEDSEIFSYLALIFGILGGLLGPVFGIITLCKNPSPGAKKRTYVGLAFFVFWIVLVIILWAIAFKNLK